MPMTWKARRPSRATGPKTEALESTVPMDALLLRLGSEIRERFDDILSEFDVRHAAASQ